MLSISLILHWAKRLCLAALSVSSFAVASHAAAQSSVADGDWPMFSRDLAGTRFSPLTQIDTQNVSELELAWSADVSRSFDDEAGGPSGNPAATPIVVDGIMYLPVAGHEVVALDAATGEQRWRAALPAAGGSDARGVAYWPGNAELGPRILVMAGPTLIALDAVDGMPARGFGRDGVAQVVVPWRGVPLVYGNLAILGAYPGEINRGMPGDTRAYDVRTGELVWTFHTVPLPGEVGHETWLDHGWRNRSGVNVWAWYMTLDAERELLYMPVSSAAGNYWGGDRPGDNLFSNSLVAVDANTGAYRWHFQTVHHDLWDLDQPNPPVLVDIERAGRTVPALTLVGKSSWVYILDRASGAPIFGVEERPVPVGDAPDEWYSPTQPFPVKPARPLSRVSFDRELDMVRPEDTSAQHAQACEELWQRSGGFTNLGPYTPFVFHEEGEPPRSTLQLPGAGGGVNWGGLASDPRRGLVFMHANDSSLIGWIEARRPGENYGNGVAGSTLPYDRGSVDGAGPYFSFTAPLLDDEGRQVASLPCYRPPWSRLVAIDVNSGEIAWEKTLGITEELPPERQLTGSIGSAGPSVTAGDLVFVGGTRDHRFRAFDASTGDLLWEARLDENANANPMIYLGDDGRQYVAVVAGSTLVSYALP
jgi:glucose dehydrogenase